MTFLIRIAFCSKKKNAVDALVPTIFIIVTFEVKYGNQWLKMNFY